MANRYTRGLTPIGYTNDGRVIYRRGSSTNLVENGDSVDNYLGPVLQDNPVATSGGNNQSGSRGVDSGTVPSTDPRGVPSTDPKQELARKRETFLNSMRDVPYFNTPGFQNILEQYVRDQPNYIGDENNFTSLKDKFRRWSDLFTTQFQDKVGRAPNDNEMSMFWDQVVAPLGLGGISEPMLQQGTSGLLENAFQRTAQEESQKRVQGKIDQALAPGSAFDTWQNQYRGAVSAMEQSLLDYQSRLMEKIRPQLMTSLHAQGLLDSGALNMAFAGASKDLTEDAQNYIAQARQGSESDIANQRYQIANAPSEYGINYEYGAIPNLTAAGQNALQNAFQNRVNENNMRLGYQLQDFYRPTQPSGGSSSLKQYAGQIASGALGSYLGGITKRAAYGWNTFPYGPKGAPAGSDW